jgi:hypothetical protein
MIRLSQAKVLVQEDAVGITTRALDIYVNGATGSDTTGDGSAANPYATITKAYSMVPEVLDHRVRIYIDAAGSPYSAFPTVIRHHILEGGCLSFIGVGAATPVSGPYTVAAFTAHQTYAAGEIGVTAPGWVADDMYGKFIQYTSGASSGYVHPAWHNTTDTVWTPNPSYPPAPGDTFTVIEPSIVVALGTVSPVMQITRDDEFNGGASYQACVAVCNLKLTSTKGSGGDGVVFSLAGGEANVGAWFSFVTIESPGACGLTARNAAVNYMDAPSGLVAGHGTGLELDDQYQLPFQCINSGGPDLDKIEYWMINSDFSNLSTRGTLAVRGNSQGYYCSAGKYKLDGERLFLAYACNLSTTSKDAYTVEFGSRAYTWNLHSLSADRHFAVMEGATLGTYYVSQEANAASYAMLVNPMGRVISDSSVVIAGATNGIEWGSGVAAVGLPGAAGTEVNDGLGAQVMCWY